MYASLVLNNAGVNQCYKKIKQLVDVLFGSKAGPP